MSIPASPPRGPWRCLRRAVQPTLDRDALLPRSSCVLAVAGCTYQRKPCQLVIHYEDGFTLLEGQANTLGREQKVLMKAPFERLRSSGDDGIRLFWLDMGGDDGEMVQFASSRRCLAVSAFAFYNVSSWPVYLFLAGI